MATVFDKEALVSRSGAHVLRRVIRHTGLTRLLLVSPCVSVHSGRRPTRRVSTRTMPAGGVRRRRSRSARTSVRRA